MSSLLSIQLPVNLLGWEEEMTHTVGVLSPTWEILIELLGPRVNMTHPWLL